MKNIPTVKMKKGNQTVIVNTTDAEQWKKDGYTVESDSEKADIKEGKKDKGK